MERYLDELKQLRMEQQDLERRLTIQMTDRKLPVAEQSLNYADGNLFLLHYCGRCFTYRIGR